MSRKKADTSFGDEIIGALREFHEHIKTGAPIEDKYPVSFRRMTSRAAEISPPEALTAEQVAGARKSLNASQTLFASFLGVAAGTVRSWEQGAKPPSGLARRVIGLIIQDPGYWTKQLEAFAQPKKPATAGAKPSK